MRIIGMQLQAIQVRRFRNLPKKKENVNIHKGSGPLLGPVQPPVPKLDSRKHVLDVAKRPCHLLYTRSSGLSLGHADGLSHLVERRAERLRVSVYSLTMGTVIRQYTVLPNERQLQRVRSVWSPHNNGLPRTFPL